MVDTHQKPEGAEGDVPDIRQVLPAGCMLTYEERYRPWH